MEVEIGESTEENFVLTCQVIKKPMSYRDHQSRGKEWNDTANIALLKPETTTEAARFFTAWLPDESDIRTNEWGEKIPAHSEIGMKIGHPVNGFVRGALFRGTQLLPSPHIFIMSKRAEDILQNHVGKKIRVTVLGEKEFDEAYEAKAETKSPYSDVP